MDDALVRTEGMKKMPVLCVLILVLMDDALVQLVQTKIGENNIVVLILVLMDDALVLQNLGYALFKRIVRLVCAS